jgi:hypothetical protein
MVKHHVGGDLVVLLALRLAVGGDAGIQQAGGDVDGSELVPAIISSRRLIRRLPFSLDSAYWRLTYISPVTFPSLWLTFCSHAPT